ncbi:hypothetical protein L9F63_005228 [Diploptera punctata]|uniref:Chemosensory protein n=1 Tax=Diploptera punctata TaxID=6984 RepID=A0AAD7ZDF1_DIPPU|nr:hypothetical protein L9F63_005228 [Diploptera punctata]
MSAPAAVLVLVLMALCACAQNTYPEEYDKLDVKSLLQDQQKVDRFVTCLLQEECSELGGKLKDVLVDALNTKCTKCTEIQKGKIRMAAKYFIEQKPEVWEQITQKYDPKGEHAEGFLKFMQEGN